MALLLQASSCVQIKDFQACALIPGNLGATCDNFLTSNQQIYDEVEWESLLASWNAQGDAAECMPSSALGNLKAEIEQLCSVETCDDQTVKAKQALLKGINQAIVSGQRSLSWPQL